MLTAQQTTQPQALASMSTSSVMASQSTQEPEDQSAPQPTGWVSSQLLRLRGGGHHPVAECCCCLCICIGIEEFCCIEAINGCLGN